MNFHDHALSLFREHAVFFAALFHLLGVAIGILIRQGHVAVKAAEIVDKQAAQIELLSGMLEGQTKELNAANEALSAEKERSQHLFSSVQIIERDRDQWRDMYWKCGLGHSNLQQMMTQQMTQLVTRLKRLDPRQPDLPTELVQAVENFRAEHVEKMQPDERRRIEAGLRSNVIATSVSDDVISRPE